MYSNKRSCDDYLNINDPIHMKTVSDLITSCRYYGLSSSFLNTAGALRQNVYMLPAFSVLSKTFACDIELSVLSQSSVDVNIIKIFIVLIGATYPTM